MISVGTTGYNAQMIRSIVSMRGTLNDLTLQLNTGLKAQTYGGLGSDRSLALSLSNKIARIDNFSNTIDQLDVRLSTAYTSVDRMNKLTREVSGQLDINIYNVLTDGKTMQQKTAANAFEEMIDLLNTDVAGSYLYGGRKSDTPPVLSSKEIMDGTATQAGFKQVLAERWLADQGSGTGRLDATVAADTVSLAEDGAHPFGLKIGSVQSGLSNVTVTQPGAPPATATIQFTGQPQLGEKIKVGLTLPGGRSVTVEMSVAAANDPATGAFAIGATPGDTANNLQAALQGRLTQTTARDLKAASAFAAADNFFKTFNGQPPQRVQPPFATATALQPGTPADTVSWYQGDDTPNATPGWTPRTDVSTLVDSSLSVNHGARANENAIAEAMARFAAVAAIDVSANTADSRAVHAAVMQQARSELSVPKNKIESIELELVHAQTSIKSVKERHTLLKSNYGGTLDSLRNSDDAEVAIKMQTLKTRMEASYAATSQLIKLSLTNYLS